MYLGGKSSLGTPVTLIMPATNAFSLLICCKKCAHVCSRRCCGLHPTLVKRITQRPKMNDISLSGYPKICANICALECPDRSCGLGSLKRSFIPRGTPQLAQIKNNYAYATRRFHDQVPLSRCTVLRRQTTLEIMRFALTSITLR